MSLASNQTATGYVAQWTDINPGADGDFTITYTHATPTNGGIPPGESQDPDNGYRKAYGPAGFMLQSGAGELPPPPPRYP